MRYSYAEKMAILEYARDNGMLKAARDFSVSSSTIVRWNRKYKIYETVEMRDFSIELRTEILQYAQKYGLTNAMRKYSIAIHTMQQWNKTLNIYKQTGRKKGVPQKQQTKRATEEYKRHVLEYAAQHGPTAACEHFDVPESTLRNWNKKLNVYQTRPLRQFTDEEKAQIITFAEMYGKAAAEREFHVTSWQILTWIQHKR